MISGEAGRGKKDLRKKKEKKRKRGEERKSLDIRNN